MTRTDPDVDVSASATYGSEDLAYFQRILEDMCDDVRRPGGSECDTKAKLAAALFKVAGNGERDYARLK